jgi:hypothetical protein
MRAWGRRSRQVLAVFQHSLESETSAPKCLKIVLWDPDESVFALIQIG